MSDNRREALEALRDKVKADQFDRWSVKGAPLTAPQKQFVTRAYNGSLDAAKALHQAVLPGWGMTIYGGFVEGGNFGAIVSICTEGKPRNQSGNSNDCPARAWLLAILSALISETPKGETS